MLPDELSQLRRVVHIRQHLPVGRRKRDGRRFESALPERRHLISTSWIYPGVAQHHSAVESRVVRSAATIASPNRRSVVSKPSITSAIDTSVRNN